MGRRKIGKKHNDTDRWRAAKKHNHGIQCTIEFYIPVPVAERMHAKRAKEKLVQEIRPAILELQAKVEELRGISRLYQDV